MIDTLDSARRQIVNLNFYQARIDMIKHWFKIANRCEKCGFLLWNQQGYAKHICRCTRKMHCPKCNREAITQSRACVFCGYLNPTIGGLHDTPDAKEIPLP